MTCWKCLIGSRLVGVAPNNEDKVQEEPELDCSAVNSELDVFTPPEVEVEFQLDQVGDTTGFGVGGDGRCNQDGGDNTEGGGFILFDWRVLDAVGFKLEGEATVQSGVGLGVWRLSGSK